MSLEAITEAAALLKARGRTAFSSDAPPDSREHSAEVLAAVEVLTNLSDLSRKAESAFGAAEYGRAYACTTDFDAAVRAAGLSHSSLSFVQPLSERVLRVSAKALQQLSDSLGRVCFVFDAVRYAEALHAFGSLEPDASLSARVVGAYEAAVLASMREYGAEVQSHNFELAYRNLLKKLVGVVQSLDAAIAWHQQDDARGTGSVATPTRTHVESSRPRFALSVVESVTRVLRSSAAPSRALDAPAIVEIYELTTRFNAVLEAFVRKASETLESVESTARAMVSELPRKHSTNGLDGIPEAGVNFRFTPRRGRVAAGGGRLGRQLEDIGPGPLLRGLSKWASRHWDVVQCARMSEARLLIADTAWARPFVPRETVDSLQTRLQEACARSSLKFSLQQAGDTLQSPSRRAGSPAWMGLGERTTSTRGGDGETADDFAVDASEITLTPAATQLLQVAADNHMLCGSRIPELRARCCRDAVELLWLVLRASFELLPLDESRKSFSDVLSTSSMVRQRQLDALSEHLPAALRSQLTTLLTPALEVWDAHSPRDLVAVCVGVECLLSLKALLAPWLRLLCDASRSANAGLDGRFVRVALQICDSFAGTCYTLACLAAACGELGVAAAATSRWAGGDADDALPSAASPYADEHLARCARTLRLRPALPLESSRKLDVALCQTTTDVLVDAYASLPATTAAASRLQMLYDARHIERGLEALTGVRPVPGAARLTAYVQAWFLGREARAAWVDAAARRLRLGEAHVAPLLAARGDAGGAGAGPALREALARAGAEVVGSLRGWVSGEGVGEADIFTIGEAEEEGEG